jgi:pimeloyl-ACP methyl ester carboxylesterase
MELREHHVPVDSGHLYAEEVGDGPPVLLLHAGVTDRRVWDPLLAPLAAGHRVIRCDSRGYGRSPAATGPFSLVADAVAVLDALGVERAHFVGLSQGGATSVDTALAHPDRVRTLTLIAPGLTGFNWPELPGYAERVAAAERGDGRQLARQVLRLWAPLSVGRDGDPLDDLAATMIFDLADRFLLDEREVEEPSAVDRLGQITAPTLVVLGDRDIDAIAAIGDLLASRIPGARLVTLPGADHILPLRVPQQLAGLLADHLG